MVCSVLDCGEGADDALVVCYFVLFVEGDIEVLVLGLVLFDVAGGVVVGR